MTIPSDCWFCESTIDAEHQFKYCRPNVIVMRTIVQSLRPPQNLTSCHVCVGLCYICVQHIFVAQSFSSVLVCATAHSRSGCLGADALIALYWARSQLCRGSPGMYLSL